MTTSLWIQKRTHIHFKHVTTDLDMTQNDVIERLLYIFEGEVPIPSKIELIDWFEGNYKEFGYKEVYERHIGDGAIDYAMVKDFFANDGGPDIENISLEVFDIDILNRKSLSGLQRIICVYGRNDEVKGIPVTPMNKGALDDPNEYF